MTAGGLLITIMANMGADLWLALRVGWIYLRAPWR